MLGFCAVPCEVKLPCTHACGMKCHWPQTKHERNCKVKVTSPCSYHPDEVTCRSVYDNSTADLYTDPTIANALQHYRCPAPVSVTLPCTHEKDMPCCEETAIRERGAAYPRCVRESPQPYVYPACRHEKSATCDKFAEYTRDPTSAPKCVELVTYCPLTCDHTRQVKCHQEQDYRGGRASYQCPQKVKVPLPRCGHEHTVACAKARELDQWQGARSREQDVVEENSTYGPKDYQCRQKVTFKRACGHEVLDVACEEAFLWAANGPPPCMEKVTRPSPYCQHACEITCHEAMGLRDMAPVASAPVEVVHEGSVESMPPGLPRAMAECKTMVMMRRRCGHSKQMQCHRASRIPDKCTEEKSMQSPLCGHEIRVPCHLQATLHKWAPWSDDVLGTLSSEERLPTRAKPTGPAPSEAPLLNCLKACKRHVMVEKPCGHETRLQCGELIQVIRDGGEVLRGKKCQENVDWECEKCGAVHEMECSKRKQISDGSHKFACKGMRDMPCWNVAACGSQAVTVPCATEETAAVCCDRRLEWVCSAGKHRHVLALCAKGIPRSCPDCNSDAIAESMNAAQHYAEATDEDLAQVPMSEDTTALWPWPAVKAESIVSAVQRLQRSGKAIEFPITVEIKRKMAKANATQLIKFLANDKVGGKFDRQLCLPMRLPVFYEIAGMQEQKLPDGFSSPASFVKAATLNGIQVYRTTMGNLQGVAAKISGDACKTLLFGYVCALKAEEKATWPPKKGANKSGQRWREQGCDCVEFVQEKGLSRLVVFDPFPLYATHRVGPLSKSELEQLASSVGSGAAAASLARCFPANDEPANGAKPLVHGKGSGDLAGAALADQPHTTSDGAGDHAAEGGPNASVRQVVKIEELRETWAEELTFFTGWDGTTLELPGVKPTKERELLDKLLFMNPKAATFAGKKVLEKQLEKAVGDPSKEVLVCYLRLLNALELLPKDKDQAVEQFDLHRALLKKLGGSCPAHPLALLAAARMPAGAPGEDPSQGDVFLRAFAARYPAAADGLCTDSERERIRQRLSASDGGGGDDEGGRAPGGAPEDPVAMWRELVEEYNTKSEAMEELLRLTGLRKVKLAAVRLFKNGLAFARMDPEVRKLNVPTLNYCFLGNPGTGKTTVARLFAKILYDSGLRQKRTFEECTAQKLKEEGADEFRKRVNDARDGVLFIDEAYDLDPVGDKFKGAPVVNEIVTTAENDREHLTIILAGYEDDMNDKFFAYNPGLKSRFKEVVFEDFDESELLEVWKNMVEKRKLIEADPRLGKVAVRRLAKMAGKKGFGNARAVRQKLDDAFQRLTARDDFDPTALVLETEDVVGENPANSQKLQKILDEISQKIGWAKVKKSVKELVEVASANYEREIDGKPPLDVFMNRLFLGNPGTGKTTCAKLYGQVLKHLGLLSNGDVIEKTASDLGGSAVGQAQQKTAALLDAAVGKVLLIDEAYALDKSQYGAQALDTIVEKVQNGSDIAVLLLGYTEEMLAMIRNQNPGLQRRFDPQQAFCFEDYTEHELLQILMYNCKSKQLKPSLAFQEKALKKLEEQRRCEPNFGNAGAVDNLVKAAVQKAMARGAAKGLGDEEMRLEDTDVDLGPEGEGGDPFAPLDGLYRMESVREKLQQLCSATKLAEDEGEDRPPLGHFVFMGAPGTGKTTVARVTAKILYRLSLIAQDKVVEVDGLRLTGEYVGQTKKKVEEKLDEAKGGVLFIDEAYELGKGTYGSEACTAIVGAMTSPKYDGLVIILAGYQADMMNMLDTNEGLKSRIQHFLEFPDWKTKDCVACFKAKARDENFAFDGAAVDAAIDAVLAKGFQKLLPLKGWGNARDVQKVWEMAKQVRADRVIRAGADHDGDKTLEEADVKFAIDRLIAARMGSGGMSRDTCDDSDPFEALDKLYRMEQVKEKLEQLQATHKIALKDGEDPPPVGHFVFSGAPGTGKTTVARATANILFRLGLINRNNVVETSGLKMTGQYVGETKTKVDEQLNKASGGVLFIDEAYELGKGQYGSEACSALVAAMTDPQYDGLVIILAGYKADMDQMLNTNAGLKSRIQHFMPFPDWTSRDCVSHFLRKAKAGAFTFECGSETIEGILSKGFEKLLPLDGWGNARDVEKVWEAAKQSRARRLTSEDGDVGKSFADVDIRAAIDSLIDMRMGTAGTKHDSGDKSDPFDTLKKLYRMEPVIRKLRQLEDTYIMAKREGDDAPPLGHFVFVGNPGTGKTTVARSVAGILFRMGLIARDIVVETSGLNLTGEYVGSTKKKVEGELDKAKGGVLFIDEAYELGKSHFGIEACSALVAAMTDPKYLGVVIIIAGYRAEISDMLDTNPGLKSRFNHFMEFPNWEPSDCVDLFQKRASHGSYDVDPEVQGILEAGFGKLVGLDGWGNARDVDDIWKAALRERATRVVRLPEGAAEARTLTPADVRPALEDRDAGSRSAQPPVDQREAERFLGEPLFFVFRELLLEHLARSHPGRSWVMGWVYAPWTKQLPPRRGVLGPQTKQAYSVCALCGHWEYDFHGHKCCSKCKGEYLGQPHNAVRDVGDKRGVGRWRKSRGQVQGPSLDDELERLATLFPDRAEALRGARGQGPHAPGPEPVASSDDELDRKVAKQRTALAMAVERDSKAERLALLEVEHRLAAVLRHKDALAKAEMAHAEAVQHLESAAAAHKAAYVELDKFDPLEFRRQDMAPLMQGVLMICKLMVIPLPFDLGTFNPPLVAILLLAKLEELLAQILSPQEFRTHLDEDAASEAPSELGDEEQNRAELEQLKKRSIDAALSPEELVKLEKLMQKQSHIKAAKRLRTVRDGAAASFNRALEQMQPGSVLQGLALQLDKYTCADDAYGIGWWRAQFCSLPNEVEGLWKSDYAGSVTQEVEANFHSHGPCLMPDMSITTLSLPGLAQSPVPGQTWRRIYRNISDLSKIALVPGRVALVTAVAGSQAWRRWNIQYPRVEASDMNSVCSLPRRHRALARAAHDRVSARLAGDLNISDGHATRGATNKLEQMTAAARGESDQRIDALEAQLLALQHRNFASEDDHGGMTDGDSEFQRPDEPLERVKRMGPLSATLTFEPQFDALKEPGIPLDITQTLLGLLQSLLDHSPRWSLLQARAGFHQYLQSLCGDMLYAEMSDSLAEIPNASHADHVRSSSRSSQALALAKVPTHPVHVHGPDESTHGPRWGIPAHILSNSDRIGLQEHRRLEAEKAEELRRLDEERERAEAEYAAEQDRLRMIAEEEARQEALRRAREAHEARLRAAQRAREEAEARRREEERRRQAVQERLRQISPCPAGFTWYKSGGGWRCGGGSHFVSDAELGRSFSS
ncbi:unnamed protein product [Prorocentrum cordatum]|uniref:AAA+ ATPase domain-containing protein n=1 Tax=Prorocentrum cordatum TaxID=2364126 RepID=A0ABN9PEA6_9DINO|nr:unnamed protein product [Polarella glacialis]